MGWGQHYEKLQRRIKPHGWYLLLHIAVGWMAVLPVYILHVIACMIWPGLWWTSSAALLIGPLVAFYVASQRS